ncbi:hypothetical protein MGG_04598 [Pyricularia oryzae 70-15]|uniref:Uncharacterized protein n=2 Tax=Pyricularia oryzae TaxID=318829 RepID=G4MRR2_PYRO7|nr:uncharacterized protein MGG_04598 [Pyricularia oryzae 70-15]EHA58277.1 hypothetical protein MGG_04598 [Pyricularia oryzae 70-15]
MGGSAANRMGPRLTDVVMPWQVVLDLRYQLVFIELPRKPALRNVTTAIGDSVTTHNMSWEPARAETGALQYSTDQHLSPDQKGGGVLTADSEATPRKQDPRFVEALAELSIGSRGMAVYLNHLQKAP